MAELTIHNLYSKKHDTLELSGIYADVLGEPESNGAWLIWGSEKNGKTWFALILAKYLSEKHKVMYVSAEEGTGKAFVDACKRAQISHENRNIKVFEYMELPELYATLKKRKSAEICFIDNITIYSEELKNGNFRKLLTDFPDKLFVFLAHEDRGEPYTAAAKLCRRLAKVIVYVKGLTANVMGRVPGGVLAIDETKAKLFYGNEIGISE